MEINLLQMIYWNLFLLLNNKEVNAIKERALASHFYKDLFIE